MPTGAGLKGREQQQGVVHSALVPTKACQPAATCQRTAIEMVRRFGFFMNWIGAQKGEGIEYHVLVLAMTASLMIRGAGAFPSIARS